MPHYTDTQLDSMYEQSKRDHAHWVGSEIRCLIADIREARAALSASPVAQEPVAGGEPYRNAIDEALVVRHLGVAKGNPREELQAILSWEVDVALDPRVSNSAQALIEQGRATPATPAGVGADEIARADDILTEAMGWHPSENGPSHGKTRAKLKAELLALLSRTSPDKSQT